MRGNYHIAVEPERDLVRISLSGFFDIEAIQAFDRDRRPAFARLTCAANQHLCLCDISGCNLQSQEAVAAFKALMSDSSLFSRKLAFFTGSSLARMQARRILDRAAAAACFETEAEAMNWLFAAESIASAA